jgi:hypothetical protein
MSDAAAVILFWGLFATLGGLGGMAFVLGLRSSA